jgi:hypothetical protein
MDIDNTFLERAQGFEQEFGYGTVMEMYLIAIMNFMVNSGSITQDELNIKIMDEMDKFKTHLTRQKALDKKMMEGQQKKGSQFSTTAPKAENIEPTSSEGHFNFSEFIKKEVQKE